MELYIGIDTSNYTTSVAAVDESGQLISDERILLTVEHGKRGLRQSDALFLHLKNLPHIFAKINIKPVKCTNNLTNCAAKTKQAAPFVKKWGGFDIHMSTVPFRFAVGFDIIGDLGQTAQAVI